MQIPAVFVYWACVTVTYLMVTYFIAPHIIILLFQGLKPEVEAFMHFCLCTRSVVCGMNSDELEVLVILKIMVTYLICLNITLHFPNYGMMQTESSWRNHFKKHKSQYQTSVVSQSIKFLSAVPCLNNDTWYTKIGNVSHLDF